MRRRKDSRSDEDKQDVEQKKIELEERKKKRQGKCISEKINDKDLYGNRNGIENKEDVLRKTTRKKGWRR